MEKYEDELNNSSRMQNPIVFQCGRCKTIIGDSTMFKLSSEVLNVIVLSYAINCSLSKDVIKGKLDSSLCEYIVISCSTCGKSLGKYYTNVGSKYVHLLELYTLSIIDIISYEIGKYAPPRGGVGKPVINTTTNANTGNINSSNLGDHTDILENINLEIEKIQHVLLNVIERLSTLEERFDSNNSSDGSKRPKLS